MLRSSPEPGLNWLLFSITAIAMTVCGCTWNIDSARKFAEIATLGSTGIQVKPQKKNHLERPVNWWATVSGYGGMKPDERTRLFLRTRDLEEDFKVDPESVLAELRTGLVEQPDLPRLHVLADLSYVEGHKHLMAGNEKYAGQMMATAVAASYQFLFDPQLDQQRNVYDPVFRQTCNIYNQSLEGLLRIMRKRDALRPGGEFTASTLDGRLLNVSISVSGRWRNEDFERFEFVSDYKTEGLRNVYLTYGLGVPLIAIKRSQTETTRQDEKYYPADLSMPLTAFVQTSLRQNKSAEPDHFAIHLIDPLEKNEVRVNDRFAPLESDITTPLAYYLDDPLLDASWFATAALLNGDFAKQFGGLYMLEPYDPEKIPVVMVHGFWSSPMTWTEMFNDLRSDKALRDNYQFWFYLYPSGQPFWFSARQMREDLAEVRRTVDPQGRSLALNEMVLVGHSMGGLVSRLQTIDSEDRFWNLVSNGDFEDLQGDPETRQRVRDTLFFEANPAIARVISLGTPHKGSNVSNSFTQWLSQSLITLPSNLTNEYGRIIKDNPDLFKSDILEIETSTDSLSPDSIFFQAMWQSPPGPRVTYHNIIGIHQPSGFSSLLSDKEELSDGVVSVESARCPIAVSEIKVDAEHSGIHQHPRAVLEVRRILNEHLQSVREVARVPDGADTDYVLPETFVKPGRDSIWR